MPSLSDPDRLMAYTNALKNWRFKGYIELELTKTAHDYVRKDLGVALSEIPFLMYQHVLENGGEIDEQPETRVEWNEYDFHYDLRFVVNATRAYLETRLFFSDASDPDDPLIVVVNIHDA